MHHVKGLLCDDLIVTKSTSIGKTPQAIAETFENADEDSVDFLDDQASVQAKNNLEVHHVQGILCDDNSLSSYRYPHSRKGSKQVTSNHPNQWILRDENECNNTVSDLVSWSKQEFGDFDKGLGRI